MPNVTLKGVDQKRRFGSAIILAYVYQNLSDEASQQLIGQGKNKLTFIAVIAT
jgi:hypothetical protein